MSEMSDECGGWACENCENDYSTAAKALQAVEHYQAEADCQFAVKT